MRKLTEVVTVEAVKRAYTNAGLKPIRDSFFEKFTRIDGRPNPTCACPLGAMILDTVERAKIQFNDFDDAGHDITAARLLDCPSDEVSYFVNGVDNDPMPATSLIDTHRPVEARLVEAYERGKEIAKAVGL